MQQQRQQQAPMQFQSNCAPMQMQQQQAAMPSQNCSWTAPPPPPRRSSYNQVSSPAPTSFNDDDSLPLVEPTGILAQPEPDPAVGTDSALTVSTRVEYSALPRGQTQDVFG